MRKVGTVIDNRKNQPAVDEEAVNEQITECDLCKAVGIAHERFMILSGELENIMEREGSQKWSDIILEVMGMCKTPLEWVMMGINLGRFMQVEQCDMCEADSENR